MSISIVNSIICEDVRKEADDKISLVGVYPRRVISLPADEVLPTRIPSIHFYLQIETGEDQRLPVVFSATSPSNAIPDLYPEVSAGMVHLFADKENALNIKLRDFPILEIGKYGVSINIGDEVVRMDFEVRQAPLSVV